MSAPLNSIKLTFVSSEGIFVCAGKKQIVLITAIPGRTLRQTVIEKNKKRMPAINIQADPSQNVPYVFIFNKKVN